MIISFLSLGILILGALHHVVGFYMYVKVDGGFFERWSSHSCFRKNVLLKYLKGLVTPSNCSHWNNYYSYSYICVFNTKWDDIQRQVANNERLPKFGHVKGRWESPFRLIFWLDSFRLVKHDEICPNKLIGAYSKP